MTKAVRIHAFGGPEVLTYEDVAVADPKAGEVLVRHTAIGLNFVDTYHRTNMLNENPPLPCVLGVQGAGVVEKTGPDVKGLKKGDRVTYTGLRGSYSEERVVPAARMIKTPDGVSDELAAAAFLRGLTCEYLVRRLHKIRKGETILVHAAAGGVGQMLVQWAKALGAVVIGTVGTDDKAKLVKKLGCDHPIVYTREDFAQKVRKLTHRAGVPVVYDLVGRATFQGSIDSLRPRGLMVCVGNASGPAPAVDPHMLSAKGSLYLTRTSLFTYTGSRADLVASARALFDVVRKGVVKIRVNHRYPLAQAARAHRDLEARQTSGSIVLMP